MNYLTSNSSSDAFDGTDMTADTMLDPNWPFNIPFTNQSAFQSAFTPAGFSFDAPFGHSQEAESSSRAGPSNSTNGHSTVPDTAEGVINNAATGVDQQVELLHGLLDKFPAEAM